MISKMESMTYEEILNRIRKDVGYSSLTTMNMQLMKEYGIYEKFKRLCAELPVNPQKNMSAIALGLSVLYLELVGVKHGYSPKEVAHLLCDKLEKRLLKTLERSCCRKNKKNPEDLIAVAETYILDDIATFKKILSTNPDDGETVLELVDELYNHQKSKKIWIDQVTRIFCVQRKEQEQTRAGNQMLPEQFVEQEEAPKTLSRLFSFDEDSYNNMIAGFPKAPYQSNQYYNFLEDSQIFRTDGASIDEINDL